MKRYIISQERLEELLEAELKIIALEQGGVDNWEWYDDSLRTFLRNDFEWNSPSYLNFFNLDPEKRPDEYEDFKHNFDFKNIVQCDITSYEECV